MRSVLLMTTLGRYNTLFNRSLITRSCNRVGIFQATFSRLSSSSAEEKPFVKYTESAAAKLRAEQHLYGINLNKENEPAPGAIWVVRISFALTLIYFCILRQENDIDQLLSNSLFETVPQLEVTMLMSSIEAHRMENLSTTQLEDRLKELTGSTFEDLKKKTAEDEKKKKK